MIVMSTWLRMFSNASVERKAESVARRLYICNDLVYVIVGAGDSFESIARDMGISERKLRKYNEVDKYYELSRGEVVFLRKRRVE